MRVPLVGGNGCCGGQDRCCSVHFCGEVERDLSPPGLLPGVLSREISLSWKGIACGLGLHDLY